MSAPAAGDPVMFEVSYWVPARFTVQVDAATAADKLRRAGYPRAAEVAAKIARREITSGDASEDDESDPLGDLAHAIAKNADQFAADGPAGEPDDYDTPETYHVWVSPRPDESGPAGTEGDTRP